MLPKKIEAKLQKSMGLAFYTVKGFTENGSNERLEQKKTEPLLCFLYSRRDLNPHGLMPTGF